MMSRHFLWLTPLANVVLFVCAGLFMGLVVRLWPRKGKWLAPRLLLALAMLPPLMVAVPGVFPEAWFLLTLGIAVRWVSSLEANPAAPARVLLWSFPGLAGLVLVLAGSILAGEWLKQRREESREAPPFGCSERAPDRARHGAARSAEPVRIRASTTPNLERLARRGIRFDGCACAAPGPSPRTPASSPGVAPRAWRGMDNAHPERVHHPGRVPGHPRLRDCRVRSERPVLFLRHRPEPRIRVLRRLRSGKAELPTHVDPHRGAPQDGRSVGRATRPASCTPRTSS